jgi:hypothetical protein
MTKARFSALVVGAVVGMVGQCSHADGGLRLILQGHSTPLIDQPGLFYSALNNVWQSVAGPLGNVQQRFCSAVANSPSGLLCEGPLPETLAGTRFLLTSPSLVGPVGRLRATLPLRFTVPLGGVGCQDFTVTVQFDFPLRVIASQKSELGPVAALTFSSPDLTYLHPSLIGTCNLSQSVINDSLTAALNPAGGPIFSGATLNNALEPYAGQVVGGMNSHFYALSNSNPFQDLVVILKGSRISKTRKLKMDS